MHIYALVDPRTELVRYVGCSVDPAKRLTKHMYGSGASRPMREWCLGLRALGLKPSMLILERNTASPIEAEQNWINIFRAAGSDLLNIRRVHIPSAI
jgi:hypothetical protein